MKKNENDLVSLKVIKQKNITYISIYYLLLLQDGRLAAGYDDEIIRIFSLENDFKLEVTTLINKYYKEQKIVINDTIEKIVKEQGEHNGTRNNTNN